MKEGEGEGEGEGRKETLPSFFSSPRPPRSLASFFARSLTLAPRPLLQNRLRRL